MDGSKTKRKQRKPRPVRQPHHDKSHRQVRTSARSLTSSAQAPPPRVRSRTSRDQREGEGETKVLRKRSLLHTPCVSPPGRSVNVSGPMRCEEKARVTSSVQTTAQDSA